MKTYKKILIGAIALSLMSFTIVNDVISQLGLSQKFAQEHILKNLVGDFRNQPIDEDAYKDDGSVRFQLKSFKLPKMSNLTSIDKKTVTQELCQYVKNYVNSQEFIVEYEKLRERAKPTSEPYRMSASEIQQMEQAIVEAEKAMKQAAAYMTAEQKAEAKKSMDLQKKEIQNMKDPTPNKTNWEKMYPENPETMVKNRLNEYLNLVSTVDFNAQLTSSGKYKKFTKPEYESKSLKWKAIYRAGKDANSVATTFAKEWLKGDIISDQKVSLNASKNENYSSNSAQNSDENSSTKEKTTVEKLKEKKNNVLGKMKGKLGL